MVVLIKDFYVYYLAGLSFTHARRFLGFTTRSIGNTGYLQTEKVSPSQLNKSGNYVLQFKMSINLTNILNHNHNAITDKLVTLEAIKCCQCFLHGIF